MDGDTHKIVRSLEGSLNEEGRFWLPPQSRAVVQWPHYAETMQPLRLAVLDTPDLTSRLTGIRRSRHQVIPTPLDKLNRTKLLANYIDAGILPDSTKQDLAETVAPFVFLSAEEEQTYYLEQLKVLRQLARFLHTAPLLFINDQEPNLKNLIATLAGYFTPESVAYESLSQARVISLESSVLVYFTKENSQSAKVMDEVSELSKRLPVVVVHLDKSNRTYNVTQLFQRGAFDYISLDPSLIQGELFKVDDERRQRKLRLSLEQLINAVHAASGARRVYEADRQKGMQFARTHLPYVFLQVPYEAIPEHIPTIMLELGARIMHPHLEGKINHVTSDAALKKIEPILKAWSPNIFYVEPSDYTLAGLREFEKFCRKIPARKIIIGYTTRAELDALSVSPLLRDERTQVADKRNKFSVAQEIRRAWDNIDLKEEQVDLSITGSTRFLSLETRKLHPSELEGKLYSCFSGDTANDMVYQGEGVSPGAAIGRLYPLDQLEEAYAARHRGRHVLLYVPNLLGVSITEMQKLREMDGIIIDESYLLHHHLFSLQRLGIPVVKVSQLRIRPNVFGIGNKDIPKESNISIDGNTGSVFLGSKEINTPKIRIEDLFDDNAEDVNLRRYQIALRESRLFLREQGLEIMINADTVEQAKRARRIGITDIGLCRTENLFREPLDHFMAYRRFVISLKEMEKKKVSRADIQVHELERKAFQDYHTLAYTALLRFQAGRRTQIRLMDFDLQELLPEKDILSARKEYTSHTHVKPPDELLRKKCASTSSRGVQIIYAYPEIYESQLRALFEAYSVTKMADGIDSDLRIFIPYVEDSLDVELVATMAERINQTEFKGKIRYRLGVTLETTGGCLAVERIMRRAGIQDFAIGTNDGIQELTSSGNRNRPETWYKGSTTDGTDLLKRVVIDAYHQAISKIRSTGRELGLEPEIGLCGELNETLLHPENLGQLLPNVDYISAGRPKRVPVLTLLATYALTHLS